ncbi:integration host factor beta-subunit [endosymbiont of Acanthamoeba sp. UWC8]|nr:HU family DNA-binding protein [Candidatus Jidaibacter acanthamoeba]AIF80793.1 integration host factor beta-subunit [endosymbiont of Acanthamoeba sp. UWC8]MBA8666592.1 integration host factor subunit beta [Holosporaceae bacterium 'Namur']
MSKAVSKKDLVSWLKKHNQGMSLNKLEEVIDIFFSEIATALVCGDRVELRGFGSMVVRKRGEKVARNPKTNQKIEVGNKGSLYFRPSKELVKQLNKSANDN